MNMKLRRRAILHAVAVALTGCSLVLAPTPVIADPMMGGEYSAPSPSAMPPDFNDPTTPGLALEARRHPPRD